MRKSLAKIRVRDPYTLGYMLETVRFQKGLTQKKFAELFGVSQGYYGDIELCRKDPIFYHVIKKIHDMDMIPLSVLEDCFGKIDGIHLPIKESKIIDDLEASDTVRRKDVDSIAWGVTMLEEYARKAESRHVMLLEDISLLSQELRKIHYTLNNRTLWQRIKNIFRKNKSTEKISTNADVNSPKKSIDLSSNPNGMQ